MAILNYLGRLGSFMASLPYLLAVTVSLAIAGWLRSQVRRKIQTVQKLVQGTQT